LIVYLHGSPDKHPVAEHTVIVAPAAHLDGQEVPAAWYDTSGKEPKPKEFQVKFYHGQAEVDDDLGRYMVKHQIAMKSRLIIPNPWDR
jgi:hypothetical protein